MLDRTFPVVHDRRVTKAVRAFAVAALCVVVLAGCTSLEVDRGAPAGDGFHLAQIEGGPVTDDRAIQVARVSTPPGNAYEWTVASVDPASSRLQLFYTVGACTNADRLRLHETATSVVIGITASQRYDGNCIAVGIPRTTTIVLRRPLAGRALMEGATGVNSGLPTVSSPSSLPDPSCSTLEGSASDVPVGMPDVTTRMAPTAATKVFVCRTWWPRGSGHAESTTITDAATVRALVAAVNGGVRSPHPAGDPEPSCTKSRGSWYDLTLTSDGVRVEVKTDEINCHTITNGSLSGTMTPELEHTLDAFFSS